MTDSPFTSDQPTTTEVEPAKTSSETANNADVTENEAPEETAAVGGVKASENPDLVTESNAPPEVVVAPGTTGSEQSGSGRVEGTREGDVQQPNVVAVEGKETDSKLREALEDPKVQSALSDRWSASSVDNSYERHEEGAWLVRDTQTGEHTVQPVTSGRRDGIQPGQPPAGEGQEVVGFYHTHPNPPVDEVGNQWTQGPSGKDKELSDKGQVPLVVQSREGYHLYYPKQKGN